jgi:hypothetical protein
VLLGQGTIDDLGEKERFDTEAILLGALITDEQLDDAALDDVLADARKVADRWL